MPSPDPLPPWLRVGVPAAVFLASFVCFSPALDGDFLNWDDNLVLTDHESWRGLGGEQVGWAFTTFRAGHYHPLTWLSFGLDYELWGFKPRGYHVANLLLHSTTAVLFYYIVVFFLERSGRSPTISRLAAAAGALFFAIHPLRVESVAWITERRDVLSGCLFMVSILAWLRWTSESKRRWYALALAAFALSLLSKAWAITLPVVLIVMDLYPLRRRGPGWLVEKIPFAALAAAAAIVAVIAQKHAGAMNVVTGHTLFERIMQSGYGLFFYVAKTVAPVAPNPLYALKPSFNPLEFGIVLGAAAAIVISVVLWIQRRRRPELLAAWAIYVAIVGPVLGLAQSGPQLVAERYTYLACLPFAILVAAGLAEVIHRPAVKVLAALVLGALGFLSWRYSHEWRASVSLWTVAVGRDSGNTQAWFNLGSAKLDQARKMENPERSARMAEAVADLSRAIDLDPRYASAYMNRGVALMPGEAKRAAADFEAALKILPDYADAYANLGIAKIALGDGEGGMADLDRAIQINPRHHQALVNRGLVRLQRREFPPARADLDAAIRLKPREPDAYYIRALAGEGEGDVDGAIKDCSKALSLAPLKWPHKDKAEELLARLRRNPSPR